MGNIADKWEVVNIGEVLRDRGKTSYIRNKEMLLVPISGLSHKSKSTEADDHSYTQHQ